MSATGSQVAAERGADLSRWRDHGRRLGILGRGAPFALGTWLLDGEERGVNVEEAAELTGLDVGQLIE